MVKGGGEGGRGIELTVDILTRFAMSLFILFFPCGHIIIELSTLSSLNPALLLPVR